MSTDSPRTQHTRGGAYRKGHRCAECRQDNSAYVRAWRQSKQGQEPPKHGTRYAYDVYGCRCGPCTEAMQAYERKRLSASSA